MKIPTLGFLVDSLVSLGNYQTAIWEGVVKGSEKHGANLVCFVGGTLERNPNNEFESRRNYIYNLISKKDFDGLIITGSIGTYTNNDKVLEFHKKFDPIPTVSIGWPLKNIPSILVENYNGIKKLTEHLIKTHGFKNIAFVSGPEGIPEAEDRLNAYKNALEENKISFDRGLVAVGDYLQPSGIEAVRTIFDKNKKRPEAIICANDSMAFGVIAELKRQKIQVPGSVAVTGFDDLEEAEAFDPPLTTFKQPTVKLGEIAVEIVLAKIAGNDVPMVITPETDIVVRYSCGCSDFVQTKIKEESIFLNSEEIGIALKKNKENIIKEALRSVNAADLNNREIKNYIGRLLAAFTEQLFNSESGEKVFLKTLNDVLSETSNGYMDVSVWHGILASLKHQIQFFTADYETLNRISEIWYSATILIGETVKRRTLFKRILGEKQATILYNISQTLITMFDIDKLMATIERQLPALGIKSCYISFFDRQQNYFPDYDREPEWARLIFAYNNKMEKIDDSDRLFLSTELLPEILRVKEKRYGFVIEPLFFCDEIFGFIIFDTDTTKGLVYSTLSGQISSSIKGALIFKDQKNAEKKLSDTLEELKHINNNLYNLSLTDELTGLYNRRGFKQLGEQQIRLSIRNKNNFILFFADMDNLKSINDNYGHKEGDNAIISISQILHDLFRKSDIIARMGGDEFTMIVIDSSIVNEDIIKTKLYKNLEKFNRESGRPYKIEISIGTAEFNHQVPLSFSELLTLADGELYKNKMEKKNGPGF